jgi:hypothetical protein
MSETKLTEKEILEYVTTVYPDNELKQEFTKLSAMNINVPKGAIHETDENIGYGTTGNKCSNHFFLKHRLRSHCEKKSTIFDWVNKNGLEVWKQKVVNDNKNNKKKPTIEDAIKGDYLSTACNQVGKVPTQFKPRIAALLMEIFKPKTVLDFSAGWGDRCLGVCAKRVNYIGIDSNVTLQDTYKEMAEFYNIHPTMVFQPAETVDFSKFDYDMVFTSPPYFTLEIYENMPLYYSYEVWEETFLKPVITNTMKYMKDGWMCLNVPSISIKGRNYPIYESLIKILGVAHKIIRMNLQSQKKTEHYENIYCWKKGFQPEIQEEQEEQKVQIEQQIVLDITGKNYSIEVKDGKLIIKIK